ncbi:MAG TPA: 50S ribosomal protein L14e [Candidatus Paceibacterota bacterium]|nr:50S ribosomal protein L14e [Candidatus Paceibacterota bacterium]
MPAIEIGRVCVKIAGRDAGHRCVVVDLIDKNFVLITGPKDLSGIKRKRVNINHIEATADRIDIAKGESDENVTKTLETAGKADAMKEIVSPRT